MPTIGYCHDCSDWVAVADDMSCPNGHAASRVNGWYDEATGRSVDPVSPGRGSSRPAGSEVSGRAAFLNDLMTSLAAGSGYTASWGSDTDMVIVSNPVDARWGAGLERAEYAAALKVAEHERTIYFWEMLRERGHGSTFGMFGADALSGTAAERTAADAPPAIGPGSASWEWGYGTLRGLVEDVAHRHGFSVRVVFTRRAALW